MLWNRDEGVLEEVAEDFGLFLEELRNLLLKNKFEYIDDIGLVSRI